MTEPAQARADAPPRTPQLPRSRASVSAARIIARRLLVLPVVLFAVAALTFLLVKLSPYDPVNSYTNLSVSVSEQTRTQIAAVWGLDGSPVEQFGESALSFLGVVLPPHPPSLGNLIAAGQRSLLAGAWWISVFPGLLILIASVAFGTLGEHWRDRHQSRWRGELEL